MIYSVMRKLIFKLKMLNKLHLAEVQNLFVILQKSNTGIEITFPFHFQKLTITLFVLYALT